MKRTFSRNQILPESFYTNKTCIKFQKSRLIWQIQILFYRRFGRDTWADFQDLMTKKLRCKHYNKPIATCDNGKVQSYDQEESKLNSTINPNRSAHTLTHNRIIISPLNENSVTTTKSKQIPNKDLSTRDCQVGTVLSMQYSYWNMVYLLLLTGFLSVLLKLLFSRVRILKPS